MDSSDKIHQGRAALGRGRTRAPVRPAEPGQAGPSESSAREETRSESAGIGLQALNLAGGAGTQRKDDDTASVVSSVSSGSTVLVTRNPGTNKRGTKGSPVEVMTNYAELKTIPGFQVKQYKVDFEPKEDQTSFKKAVMYSLQDKLGSFIFDGSVLYTAKDIPDEYLIQHSSFKKDTGAKQINYVIQLKKVKVLEPTDPVLVQFYNNALRRAMALMGYEQLFRNFFDTEASIKLEQDNMELWPGYVTAIRNHDNGWMLCVETTHKVIRTRTMLEEINGIKQRNVGKSNKEMREILQKELIGQIVLTRYNNKTYRIDDVDVDCSPLSHFHKTNNGVNEITKYKDYYQGRHGITITELEQPMLVSYPKKKDINKGITTNIYLVPSLCYMTGLSDDMRKDFGLMQRLSKYLHMEPKTRVDKLQAFVDKLKTNEKVNEELKKWDIEISPIFVNATARVLTPNQIMLTKDGRDKVDLPDRMADWTRLLKQNQMLSSVCLDNWLVFAPTGTADAVVNLVTEIVRQGRLLGMAAFQPLRIVEYKPKNGLKEEEQLMGQIMSEVKKGLVKMVLYILPTNALQRYATVKKNFVLKHGVNTQCFLQKNLRNKNFVSVVSKLMIQMNAKMGGEPWSVKLSFQDNKMVMIMGYDVYHCTERKNESVGALVASTNMRMTKYYSQVSFHKNKSELAVNLCEDTKKCLDAFKKANGCLPERIILYRDGVGEGQIQYVLESEVSQMRDAINSEYGDLEEPKFTFIVVTKKINTRYLGVGKVVTNAIPGTVLDNTVTLPERYDFFLVSQSVRQGTVSPSNYNVVYDNSDIKPDMLQGLTYKMCHLYFNWSGTVAVPAPVQFAHKLAYLTGVALADHAPADLQNLLWYL